MYGDEARHWAAWTGRAGRKAQVTPMTSGRRAGLTWAAAGALTALWVAW